MCSFFSLTRNTLLLGFLTIYQFIQIIQLKAAIKYGEDDLQAAQVRKRMVHFKYIV